MADFQNTTAPAVEMPASAEQPVASSGVEPQQAGGVTDKEAAMGSISPANAEHVGTDGPVGEANTGHVSPVDESKTTDAAVAEDAKTQTPVAVTGASKAAEPITGGALGYKAPGLLNSLAFSKKHFWLGDAPVTAQHMDHYMRGEKPEASHPVVAWATQTGKGLLFFNKKGVTDRSHPMGVLPLYDASDLEKKSPHEFSFKLHGHTHTFKAANDAERDAWYMSLEKAVEMGKASVAGTRGGDGYKDSIKKLGTPNILAAGAAGAVGAAGTTAAIRTRDQSKPKKSTELDKETAPARVRSSSDEDVIAKRAKKDANRSRSRGVIDRLRSKRDDFEAKRGEKQEEKVEKEEEKMVENKEAEEPVEAGAALDAPGTAARVMGAPVEESNPAEATEALPAATAVDAPAETKTPKTLKRNSVFGRMSSGWSSIVSPSKEKSQGEAELGKPSVPPKDTAVSAESTQLPETTTSDAAETLVPAAAATHSDPAEPLKALADEKDETSSPATEKGAGGFLSSIPFINRGNRSVSPSRAAETAPTSTDAPAVPPKDIPTKDIPTKDIPTKDIPTKDIPTKDNEVEALAPTSDEPLPTTPAAASTEPTTDAEPVAEEPKATSPTTKEGRRTSLFGNFFLGRRASSALRGGNKLAKKDMTTPTPATDAPEVMKPATANETMTNGKTMMESEKPHQSNADVVSDAVNVGQPVSAAA